MPGGWWWRRRGVSGPVSGAGPSVLSKGGRVLLRPSHQLLCQPLWSCLIKWRLSRGSPSHNRLWCEAHIITMTGRLPIRALLLSWENAPHSAPAGGKNWSGLSVILPGPEITVNHPVIPLWQKSARDLSSAHQLSLPKVLTSRRAHPGNINWNNEISTWRNRSANLCFLVLWVDFRAVAQAEQSSIVVWLGQTAPWALPQRGDEHIRSISLMLKACICLRKKLARWYKPRSDKNTSRNVFGCRVSKPNTGQTQMWSCWVRN